jgi:hypothetical protein
MTSSISSITLIFILTQFLLLLILLTYHSLVFLLSMNEVNIKYWFRNFQKKSFYRFSVRIRTFYRRKTDLYEIKNSVTCRLPRKVSLSTTTLSVQLRDFSFWISDWFGPQSILLIFGLREQIPSGSSHTNFWLLFHSFFKVQVEAFGAQKRNLLVMNFL